MERSECDSPFSLANETFRWIEKNLRDEIDFVLWTGDSARHDNDEEIPRQEWEIFRLNELMVSKFVEVFGVDEEPDDTRLTIPIVPTFGNNDMLPHNIFRPGPNTWTRKFVDIWDRFIPEEQRHAFVQGGWFTAEVIPGKLAAISLNTMYFFDSNNAVDGCYAKSEPGYEHMEWLRVQLERLRERDMKAILIGHVPPARSSNKISWEESCWQKYTLWVHQFRDIIVGSVYGHMNIDHFMLQDSRDLEIAGFDHDEDDDDDEEEGEEEEKEAAESEDQDASITSRSSYLSSLRRQWSKLPSPPEDIGGDGDEFVPDEFDRPLDTGKEREDKGKFLKRIGGPFAERYSVSLVSPSVVPNYFPTLRVMEYNITGLEDTATWRDVRSVESSSSDEVVESGKKQKKNNKKKKKKGRPPSFTYPKPPSKTALPGPAYSNQALSLLSYRQYYANLTRINDAYAKSKKHNGFDYEVEYDTKVDRVYKLKDLTVRSFFKLASRLADGALTKNDESISSIEEEASMDDSRNEAYETHDDNEEAEDQAKRGKKGKKRGKKKNRAWVTFLYRAFVGNIGTTGEEDAV